MYPDIVRAARNEGSQKNMRPKLLTILELTLRIFMIEVSDPIANTIDFLCNTLSDSLKIKLFQTKFHKKWMLLECTIL